MLIANTFSMSLNMNINESTESAVMMSKSDVTNEDDDEEILNQGGLEDILPSEDEGGSDEERKHRKLIEAISSLGGKKRKKLAERSEASIQMSEFTINNEGEGEKINLSDLIGTMDKVPSSNNSKKHLKNLQTSQNTLELPLSKQENERIRRRVAFDKTAQEVSRWQTVIMQNQRAEQLVFPLNQEPSGPKRVEQVVAGWKAQTPLEQEIFHLLHINKQPVHDPVLTPMEEASMRAMSLEEAKIRRAELQKARVLQSYYEAKAKRAGKIKSKKYHRVQKKSKRKEFLKEFDEMCKTDPAAALEELKKIEFSRMQERMSLKHQNSGKWAKSKALMAKYDEGARKAMQQQLEVNKDLTQKLEVLLDDNEVEEEDPDTLPEIVNDAEPVLDHVNPWMRGKLSVEHTENQAMNCIEPSVVELEGIIKQCDREEGQEEEVEETEDEVLLREFERKRKLRRAATTDMATMSVRNQEQIKADQVVDISDDEEQGLSEFTNLFHGIVNRHVETQIEQSKMEIETFQKESPVLLEEGLVRVRTIEDVEQLNEIASIAELPPAEEAFNTEEANPQSGPQKTDNIRKRKKGIDPNEVLTKEAKVITVPLAPTAIEVEEKEQQRVIIKEAFAGDDVISDFLKDKKKQEEAGRSKVVDLTLPGWGEWGGLGLKPSNSKRRRFKVKVAPPPPRKDKKLPNIIISEKRDSSVAAHQVSLLPFPFENPEQFERTIRSPVGRTWNTQQAVKKITAPKVVTQLGAIIEPMTREELMRDQKKAVMGNRASPSIILESEKVQQRKPFHKRSQTNKKSKHKKRF